MTSAVLYDVTSRFNLELSFDIALRSGERPYTGTPLVPSSFRHTRGQRGREHDGRPNRGCADAAAELQRARCRHERVDDLDEVESDVARRRTFIELRNQAYYYTAKRDWMNGETYRFQ
jgi:iron complex outermembrane receptor protein